MYTIEIEKECRCIKESGISMIMEFEERQDMINKARVLECRMNQEFCMTHFFEAMDCGDKVVIKSTVRPVEEDDDDVENACDLVRNSPTIIGFDGSAESPDASGGN